MGALHAGHRHLIELARAECDVVVVSVFVNPMQFDDHHDFEAYPSTFDADASLCRDAGVDLLFAPTVSTMYPRGFDSRVVVGRIGEVLEGRSRSGHYDGVATVVAKLFGMIDPDVAYFGQKDFQQTLVIRRLVEDLNLDVALRVVPTVRESDGLALSSRNVRLDDDARTRALAISKALNEALESFASGNDGAESLVSRARATIEAAGLTVDYVVLADPGDLSSVEHAASGHVMLVAAHVNGVRLIDNVILA